MDETVSRLIWQVQNKEFLYNLYHADYKNLKKKQKAWAEIAADLEMSVDECKRKWKWLRNSFNRENSKRNKSGQGIDKTDTGWKYFSELNFLKDFKTPLLTIGSHLSSTSEYEKEPKAIEAQLASTLSSVQTFLECYHNKDMDEDDLFCASLSQKLKKFPLNVKNEMKLEILNLLNKKEEELFDH